MPLIKCGDPLPDWSELDFISIMELKRGEMKVLLQKSPKEKIFIGKGVCEIFAGGKLTGLKREQFIELRNPGSEMKINAVENSMLIYLGGRWTDETGSCGVFSITNSDRPRNAGDPVDYERRTDFDNHFHDCDEYWIIFEGSGLAVSEGETYLLKPGYVLATKMGDHHDLPNVFEEIHGVWFETSLKGKKRTGHLWNHSMSNI